MAKTSPIKHRLRIALALVIILAGLYLLFSPHGLVRYTGQRHEIARLRESNATLTLENSALRQEIDRLRNDPTYLEGVARDKYGFLKKNEIIYEFPEKKKH